jgi:micrococcal nuclease
MYQYKIKQIVKVIDGDTVDVDIDLGFNLTIRQRVRLKGINAPESRTTDKKEKKLGLESKEWLESNLSESNDWFIKTYKDDKYGRILGVLYREDYFCTLNQKMIVEGKATPYMV